MLVYGAAVTLGFCFITGYVFDGLDGITYAGLKKSPPDNDWYLAYNYTGTLDHGVIYWNIGSSIKNLEKADVVILGNSRVLIGFDWHTLEVFGKKHGIRFFNLGFGWSEPYIYPMMILERYNIHPKIVIISADTGFGRFFTDKLSPTAKRTIKDGKIKTAMSYFSRSVSWRYLLLRSTYLPDRLNKILPDLPVDVDDDYRTFYRSRVSGGWYLGLIPATNKPINNPSEFDCAPTDEELAHADKLLAQLNQMGATPLLTITPYTQSCLAGAELVAERMKSRFIKIESKGYNTWDGDHMTPESARRFTEEFLRQFERSDLFLNLVGAKN